MRLCASAIARDLHHVRVRDAGVHRHLHGGVNLSGVEARVAGSRRRVFIRAPVKPGAERTAVAVNVGGHSREGSGVVNGRGAGGEVQVVCAGIDEVGILSSAVILSRWRSIIVRGIAKEIAVSHRERAAGCVDCPATHRGVADEQGVGQRCRAAHGIKRAAVTRRIIFVEGIVDDGKVAIVDEDSSTAHTCRIGIDPVVLESHHCPVEDGNGAIISTIPKDPVSVEHRSARDHPYCSATGGISGV